MQTDLLQSGFVICRAQRPEIRCTWRTDRYEASVTHLQTSKLITESTGVGTRVDPTLCRADRLVGFVLGLKGRLPSIYTELEVNYFLLRRLLGVKSADGKQAKVAKLGLSMRLSDLVDRTLTSSS